MKVLTVFFLFYLTGCASNQLPELAITIHAVSYLNPNIYHQASPIVVSIYQLKSATLFGQLNFFALNNSVPNLLNPDLLDKSEIEIRPEQTQTVTQTLAADTRFIGVVAAYRDPENAQWRRVLPIAMRKKVNLQIELATQAVGIRIK